jgi:succinoglycan biosynthesis transport protein ExoP
MLQLATQKTYKELPSSQLEGNDTIQFFDIKYILSATKRQAKLIIGMALAGALVGIVYLLTSVPLYTATTSLIIDRRQVRAIQDVSAITDVGLAAPIIVDSQVEVLKSPRIALAVVDRLDLITNQDFRIPEGWLLTWIYRWIAETARDFISSVNAPDQLTISELRQRNAQRAAAASRLLGRMTISRVGQTYLVTVSYSGANADQAAHIANAYVESYLDDQLSSGYEATKRANSWLQGRLEELRKQSAASDLAVQQFREENNLISVGGQLITDVQLGELNSQLSAVRGDVARAAAKLERVRAVLKDSQAAHGVQERRIFEAAIAELTPGPMVEDLQARYSEASRRETEIAAQFGSDHGRAAQYRAERHDVERQILAELARVSVSSEGEHQIAKARLEALGQSMDSLSRTVAATNTKMVQLRELEQTADSYKTLYRSFLERYQQTIQQQSIPVSDARVVTSAASPMQPSSPKGLSIVALTAFMGALAGGAFGALREYHDDSVRTGDRVRDELGLRCLGMLPAVSHLETKGDRKWVWLRRMIRRDQPLEAFDLAHYFVNSPHSIFAENLRSIAAGLVHTCPPHRKIIGVLSVSSQEGRTVIASNLAALFASEGNKALLIDADLRNPHLTSILAPKATQGLLEVLAGGKSLEDVIHPPRESSPAFVPTLYRQDLAYTIGLTTNGRFEEVLKKASESFEYVIVDLPSLQAASDLRFLASKLDCLLLVVDAARTSKAVIKATLANNESAESRCLGVVLNRVDVRYLRLASEHRKGARRLAVVRRFGSRAFKGVYRS